MQTAIRDAFSVYRFVLGRPRQIIRFGLWPLLTAIVLLLLLGPLIGVSIGFTTSLPFASDTGSLVVAMLLSWLPWIWFAAVFAVRWHRLVLMGEDRTSGLNAAFGERVGRYFASVCLLQAIGAIALAAGFAPIVNLVLDLLFLIPGDGSLIAEIWRIGVMVAFVALLCGIHAFLLSQIGLMFPSISTDQTGGPKKAWKLAEGRRLQNFLTLFFVLVPPPVLWMVIGIVISDLSGPAEAAVLAPGSRTITPVPPSLVAALLTYVSGIAVTTVMTAAIAVALSNMYRAGTDRQPG